MIKLNDLYARKGELITRIEVMQSQLKQINQVIIEELNKPRVIKNEKSEVSEKNTDSDEPVKNQNEK